jgi:hypothetical protein
MWDVVSQSWSEANAYIQRYGHRPARKLRVCVPSKVEFVPREAEEVQTQMSARDANRQSSCSCAKRPAGLKTE